MKALPLLVLAALALSGCILFNPPAATPTPTPEPTPTPLPTAIPECASDADCAVQGCASQWCAPEGAYDLPCRWNEWYACLNRTTCGCTGGVCDWRQTQEFQLCKRASSGCPRYEPASGQAVADCRMRGGEILSLPDDEGCFVEPACSADIRCGKDVDCPLGFSCSGNACRPAESFCGGVNSIECSDGWTCVFGGGYYLSPGECRDACRPDGSCDGGKTCENGVCVETRDRGCEQTGCAGGYVCRNQTCVSIEGMPCAGPGASACPDGYYCVTPTICRAGETCMNLTGACRSTSVPAALSRYCGHDVTFENNPVSAIGVCANGYFRVMRGGNHYAYAYADGSIFRECGASAVNQDPACDRIDSECGEITINSCTALAEERYVYCPPAYSVAQDCPATAEPVCAKILLGSIPALRQPAWEEYQNACLACSAVNESHVPDGFLVGGCG